MSMAEEEQKKLEEQPEEEETEEDPKEQGSEESPDLFGEWLDEVEERFDRIEERFGDRRDVELIKDKGIRPYFYFKDDEDGENASQEAPITNKQESYLLDLADNQPKRFWEFVNNEDDIEGVGPPEEVVGKLTKKQASEIIDFLNQPKDYEDHKKEKA